MKRLLVFIMVMSLSFSLFVGCAPKENVGAETTGEIAFPERNITMTIPFGAGGGTDIWARIISQYMGEELGVQIIANNVTGGSAGSTGIKSVWDAPHDGYTLAATSETPLTIPVMTTETQTTKDWEYFIAAGSPGLLCVNKKTSE